MPEIQFRQEYQRKRQAKINDILVSLVSPEDLILTKLSWCKKIFSERHFNDCVGIWRVQKGKLDTDYLKKNAKDKDIEMLVKQIIS